MNLQRRPGHSKKQLMKTTVAAQIHLLGAILMFVGAFYLLAASKGDSSEFRYANLSYATTGVLVFLGSFLFHFLTEGYQASNRLEVFLEKIDHCGIYLFIAGTYSAFLVAVIAEPWKTRIFVMIWLMAAGGVLYTFFYDRMPKWLKGRLVYTLLFVMMGWTILLRTGEILDKLGGIELALFLGGAIFYTIGAVIFYRKKPSFFNGVLGHHEIWHLLVILGAASHFFLIYSFNSEEFRTLLYSHWPLF